MPESIVINENQIQWWMLSKHVRMAFGLDSIQPQDSIDLLFMNLWVVIGISMFGYSIGNISSQLNYSRKEDIEQGDHMSFFNELSTLNNLDDRLQNLIIRDINEYFNNQQDREFMKKGSTLSKSVFLQVEMAIQKSFIDSFPMFNSLNINTLRILKYQHIKMYNPIIIRIEQEMEGVYMVTHGNFQLQDENMVLKNEFFTGQMQGFKHFLRHCEIKQGVKLESWLNIDNNPENASDKMEVIEDLRNFINKKRNFKTNLMIQDHPTHLTEDATIIKSNLMGIGNNHVEYQLINWAAIEEIMLNDFNSFKLIWEQYLDQEKDISETEKVISDATWYTFSNSYLSSIVIIKEGNSSYDPGYVQNCNKNLEKQLKNINLKTTTWNDNNFFEFAPYNIDNENYTVLDNTNDLLKDETQIIRLDNRPYKIKVLNVINNKIQRLKNKQQNKKVSSQYMNKKKNLIDVKIIGFEIESI